MSRAPMWCENQAEVNAEGLGAAALRYAVEPGFAVFPLAEREKKPRAGSAGLLDASSHPEQVGEWWDRWPNANIGVATGASGLVVIDTDDAEADHELRRRSRLPRTATVRTSRGFQYYFLAPASVKVRNSASKLGPKIDVRGDGGYVVAPPSVHPCGHLYAWVDGLSLDDVPLAELPPELLEAATREEAPPARVYQLSAATQRVRIDGALTEGGRNVTLHRLGSSLRARGASEAEIEAKLLAVNAAHCAPPLGAREVRTIAKSCGRYAQGLTAEEYANERAERLIADNLRRQRIA